MSEKEISNIYLNMVQDAYAAIDTMDCWAYTKPFTLARTSLRCADGTKADICLVEEYDDAPNSTNTCLRAEYKGWYVSCPLLYDDNEFLDEWKTIMLSDTNKTKALAAISEIIKGGKDYLENIVGKGTRCIDTMVITEEKRFAKTIMLPYSCALSVYGEVFHGVREIKDYCKDQQDDSSPYILKRCLRLLWDEAERDNGTDNTGNMREMPLCRSYLICKSKDEAMRWMRTFIGICQLAALHPDDIPQPNGFPPLVCHVDGTRHMILAYR